MTIASYSFGQALWTMFIFFGWVLFFWLLFVVLGDLFRRHDISGWGKAGWTIFVIVLPFIGIFAYLIAQGHGMADRQEARAQGFAQQSYAAGPGDGASSAADQITKAKALLDSGAIDDAEFAKLKASALAG